MQWTKLKDLCLAEPRLTLAVAESLTAGAVQVRIGSVSGVSGFFLGGMTTYALEEKVRHLGVDRATAEACNAVSAEVARQMARGVARLFGSDLAVATTGYAEAPAEMEDTMPFAWWAVAHDRGPAGWVERCGRVMCLRGTRRTDVQGIIADAALTELVEYLESLRA